MSFFPQTKTRQIFAFSVEKLKFDKIANYFIGLFCAETDIMVGRIWLYRPMDGDITMAMKYKFLADLLREELVKNGGRSGFKLPTEAELVRRYHMSRQTVRHALQLLADEGLVQSRQGSGTYTTGLARDPASRQIAVVTSFLDDYIFPTILHDAQSVFSQKGYSTLVYATENRVADERDILLRLLEQPVGGILVEGSKTALPSPNADLYRRRGADPHSGRRPRPLPRPGLGAAPAKQQLNTALRLLNKPEGCVFLPAPASGTIFISRQISSKKRTGPCYTGRNWKGAVSHGRLAQPEYVSSDGGGGRTAHGPH